MSELKIIHDSWELNKVFTISRSSKKTAETIEVQISKNGKIGFGEGVPYSHYNETIESVTSQIEELRCAIENEEINNTVQKIKILNKDSLKKQDMLLKNKDLQINNNKMMNNNIEYTKEIINLNLERVEKE